MRDGVLRDYLLDGVNRRQEAAGGRPLEYEDKRDAILEMHQAIRANLRIRVSPDIVANVEDVWKANQHFLVPLERTDKNRGQSKSQY